MKRSLSLLLVFTIALLTAIALPVVAKDAPHLLHTPYTLASAPLPSSPLDQGRLLYEAGQFEQALATWQAAELEYTRNGDSLNAIRSRINQAQAQKSLGFYRRAVEILERLNQRLPEQPVSLEKAQVLRSLGEAYLSVGDLLKAEEILNQSLKLSTPPNYTREISHTYLSLGLVERAKIGRIPVQELRVESRDLAQPLESVNQFSRLVETATTNFEQATAHSPDATTKLQAELNQIRLLADSLPRIQRVVLDSLVTLTSDRLTNLSDQVLQTLLNDPSLKRQANAKTLVLRENDEQSVSLLTTLKAQTAQALAKLLGLVTQVQIELDGLPASRASVDARINYAQSLIRLTEVATTAFDIENQLTAMRADLKQYQAQQLKDSLNRPAPLNKPAPRSRTGKKARSLDPPYLSKSTQLALKQIIRSAYQSAAVVLQKAVVDAQTLQNKRAESYAVAALAELYYRQAKAPSQWADVETLTKRSLRLSQESNAPEIAYRMQGVLGFSLKNQNRASEARSAFLVAARNLQSIRGDLVAVDPDIQFNFRDSVEPIYREAVEALLPTQGEQPVQTNLEEARRLIESLQLAELDNFLREACVEGRPVALDRVVDQDNPTTAIIYPIILNNSGQLRVIAKIPGQKDLRYHAVDLPPREDVEITLENLQQKLKGLPEISWRPEAVKVYSWLIQPLQAELAQSKVDTLVFVPDKTFRNVPMSVLYDAAQSKFLIQEYAIAVSPGLQLYDPKPLAKETLNVLTAGKSQFADVAISPIRGRTRNTFAPLPYVEKELELIGGRVRSQTLFEKEFTSTELKQKINSMPFNVVHLATHGVFGYRKEETFIVADDGLINVDQLSTILRGRNQAGGESIELLVLSACQTAEGDNRVTLGLAGIAIRAGARSTLGSLWSINDQSTAILMDRFYQELATAKTTGITKAKALQAAQLSLLNEPNGAYTAPSYWAPYVLVGNWL